MSQELDKRRKTTITSKSSGKKMVLSSKTKIQSSTGKVSSGKKVDIVFVFDTTGSMDGEIHGLLKSCKAFVDEAYKMALRPNFALIAFGDIKKTYGGDTIELVVPLTDDIGRIKAGLSEIPRNLGYGNGGESCFEAIQFAFELSHRKDAVKVMIVITDEPAHQHQITSDTIISYLSEREYLVFTIATNDQYYKEMAKVNGGEWRHVSPNTDLSSILDMFKETAKTVSRVASDVHKISDGSVKDYLKLNAPKS